MKIIYLLYIITVVSAIVFVEGVALILLHGQVARYKKYWDHRATETGDFVYVALGDSAAQGIGASQPEKGYVGQIAKRVADRTGKKVRVINLSVSGAVINDVLVSQLPASKKYKPDLVTIEIGANDMAHYDKQAFTERLTRLVQQLPKGTYVANMPFFQTRPARRAAAEQASGIIQTLVANRDDLKQVDLQAVTKKRSSWFGYAADLFHPTERNYKNWADVFWKEIDGQL